MPVVTICKKNIKLCRKTVDKRLSFYYNISKKTCLQGFSGAYFIGNGGLAKAKRWATQLPAKLYFVSFPRYNIQENLLEGFSYAVPCGFTQAHRINRFISVYCFKTEYRQNRCETVTQSQGT